MYWCKWKYIGWLIFAIAVFLASCNEPVVVVDNVYFDSKEFAEKEIESLESKVSEVSKTIVLNGKSETIEHIVADSTVYREMLSILKEANINKAKFASEYTIDTFWMMDPDTNENVEVLNYTTENPTLKVRWMQVYSDGSIKAFLSKENYLFSYEKEIYYGKDKNFSVISWQKTRGQDTLHIFRTIDFVLD